MKKFNSVLVCIGLLIAAATMVPFTSDSISVNEAVIKFAAFPLLVLLIAITGVVGKDKKVEGKKGFYGAALLLSAYISSVYAFFAFFTLRNNEFSLDKDLPILVFTGLTAVVFIIFALALPKFEHRKALFMPLTLFFLISAGGAYILADKNVGVMAEGKQTIMLAASAGLAGFTTIAYLIEYFVMTKKLTETNMERDVILYQEILNDNLKDIYDYSKNELQNRGVVFEETKVEVVKEIPVEKIVDREIVKEVPVEKVVEKEVEVIKEVPIPQYVEKEVIKEVPVVKEVEVVKEVPVVKEVEKVVEKVVEVIKEVPVIQEVEKVVVKEIPVEKVIEVVKEVPVDKVVQVVKEIPVEKVIEVEKPKKAAAPKIKLVVKPSPQDIANQAMKMFDDVNIVYGKDQETFKIVFHNKPIMLVAGGSNGYKITFQRKPISATKLLMKYPNICQKASNPKGDQWFKITNKGDVDVADLYDLIKFSRKYVEDEEAAAAAKIAKAEARAKAQEEKAKQKVLEAEERARQKQIEAEERAKQKQIEAEEKARQKEEARRLAQEEKARQKAILDEEKARQKAILAEERAKQREEAKRLAQEEKARLKEEAKKAAAENANAQKEAIKEAVIEALTEYDATKESE